MYKFMNYILNPQEAESSITLSLNINKELDIE